jgi:Ca2+-transporting ATPase
MPSPTHTHVDTASVLSRSQHAKSDISIENVVTVTPSPDPNPHQNPSDSRKSLHTNGDVSKIDLVQDDLADPCPFKFRPVELASLLDPKNLDALEALGGIDAILDGLGTDPSRGLTLPGTAGAGVGASQRHDRQPHLSVATPHDHLEVQVSDNPHTALIDDRKRVFGDNVLPQRTSKSLLALMWLALQDKVLVRIYQIGQTQNSSPCVSRSCCLLQRSFHSRLACFKILGHLSLLANPQWIGWKVLLL